VRRAALLVALLASGPALGQTRDSIITCGSFTAQSWREGETTRWTVTHGSEKTSETGVLRSSPRFECLEGKVLVVEIAFASGNGTLAIYFPDGSELAYGRQQIDRRGTRYVLPIQAKARIAPAFRAAFDYHCRMDMPLSPIAPGSRAECVL
jgi:hypothetical protein